MAAKAPSTRAVDLSDGEHQQVAVAQPQRSGQVQAAVAVPVQKPAAPQPQRDAQTRGCRRDDPDAGEGVSLLCRNLGYNTDKEVVRNAFKEFGRVRPTSTYLSTT